MILDGVALRWQLDPLQVVPTLLFAALYVRRARTLARRGAPVPAWRQWLFHTGVVLLLVALVSPIDSLGETDFLWVHMIQHVLLGDLAPLCMVAGLTGPMLRPVLAIGPIAKLRSLAHPFVALPLWAFDLYLWHAPPLYQAALHHNGIHAFEHICFFVFGTLMWAPVLEVLPAPEWFGTGVKLGYIALVRVFDLVLGNVFLWSHDIFYPFYEHGHPLWGISAVEDQNLAGVVMMAYGSTVTVIAIAWLFLRLAAEGELRQQLLESGLDPRAVRRAVRYGRGKELSHLG